MKEATAADMRRIEQLAVERGDTYEDLMERAGKAAALWISSRADLHGLPVTVVCGRGNNGGDGLVLARYLCETADVTVVLAAGVPVTDTAALNHARLMPLTLRQGRTGPALTVLSWQEEPYLCSAAVREASVVVDCLYGIGFHGQLPAELVPLLHQMNDATGCKVAVDMPSGVSADGEEGDGDAFRAEYTLTFTASKVGLRAPESGQVEVLDIGISPRLVEQVLGQKTITESLVRGCFSPRPSDSHKGTFGRVVTVCGSYGMAGAAMLCIRAALRSGVGLVTAAVPRSVYPLLAPVIPEAVFLPLPEDAQGRLCREATEPLLRALQGASAVVVGPGLGRSEELTELVEAVLRRSPCPIILDADGINAVRPHMVVEEAVSAPLILTPHPGEMARLLDTLLSEVQQHRTEIARRFAEEYGVTLVLKGHHTLVAAPDRPLLQNETGNPGMATGGSGDVLAGLIGGLAAQGLSPYESAMCGVYLHGLAGDRAAARLSQHGMLPSDMIEELGGLFLNLEK